MSYWDIGFEFLLFVVCVGFTVAGGFLSYLVVRRNEIWYDSLKQPVYSPSIWTFSFGWSIMYLLLGISSFFAFRKHYTYPVIVAPLTVHLLHLLLNFTWTSIFFELKLIELVRCS